MDVMAYGKRDEVVGQRIHLEAVAPGMTRRGAMGTLPEDTVPLPISGRF